VVLNENKPPPFIGDRGAVPDTDKLAASIQTDPNGFWWGGSKCDYCEYEAAMFDGSTGHYLCWNHRANREKRLESYF
jgi:hypothetical protein